MSEPVRILFDPETGERYRAGSHPMSRRVAGALTRYSIRWCSKRRLEDGRYGSGVFARFAPRPVRGGVAEDVVAGEAEGSMTGGTLLIAEDNESLRIAFAEALRAKGYTVLEAENGAEAVRLATEHRPGLILLDLMMPVLDGWSAAQALQENPVTARIPRLALTALQLDPSRLDKLATDFALVLRKPLALSEVCRAIERLLGEHAKQP